MEVVQVLLGGGRAWGDSPPRSAGRCSQNQRALRGHLVQQPLYIEEKTETQQEVA